MADPNILTFIGNVSEELNDLPIVPTWQPKLTQDRWDARARNAERSAHAEFLIGATFEFLVHHELAHIENGHVDYLGRTYGNGFISEFFSSSSDEENLTRQSLEMDADAMAVSRTVGALLSRLASGAGSHMPFRKTLESPELALSSLLFGIISLFRIFGECPLKGIDFLKASIRHLACASAWQVGRRMLS